MKLKRLAQSTIILYSKSGKSILIDPGKYNLGDDKYNLDNFPITDVVVITHKHADHFDLDIVKAILKRSNPLILTNKEINGTLSKANIKSEIIDIGDERIFEDFSITAIRTDHVVRDEEIICFGVVINCDNTTVYHTSDTRFIEPNLLPKQVRADYLLLPISNRGVVMGIDDALVFSSELKPKLVIPVHYDSPKDKERVNPNEFIEKSKALGLNSQILPFNSEIEL